MHCWTTPYEVVRCRPVDDLRRRWGQNVAAQRKVDSLTQRQLAEKVGVTQQAISNIERGHHAPSDALKVVLVQHLEATGADLFPLDPG